jgi:hypothetical protein
MLQQGRCLSGGCRLTKVLQRWMAGFAIRLWGTELSKEGESDPEEFATLLNIWWTKLLLLSSFFSLAGSHVFFYGMVSL